MKRGYLEGVSKKGLTKNQWIILIIVIFLLVVFIIAVNYSSSVREVFVGKGKLRTIFGGAESELVKHLACVNSACIEVFGEGDDECTYDDDCADKHMECTSKSNCEVVDGPGPNTCLKDSDCVNSHLVCVNAACILVESGGPDTCASDSDCGGYHTICAGPKGATCTPVPGTGPNECLSNANCVDFDKRLVCQNNACVEVYGQGPDLCASNADCVEKHSECTGGQYSGTCTLVEGPGPSTCFEDSDCTKHLTCVNDACVLVSGSGINDCSTDSQCKGKHMECRPIVPGGAYIGCYITDGPGPSTCFEDRNCVESGTSSTESTLD